MDERKIVLHTEEPLYRETDVEKLTRSDRFLAISHSYSLNKITLGKAVFLSMDEWHASFKDLSPGGYYRLIQEVAERISRGEIAVPGSFEGRFSEIYLDSDEGDFPSWIHEGAGVYRFINLSDPSIKKSALGYWRESYSDEDIKKILETPRFLACVDAYNSGHLTFGEMSNRMFGTRDRNPFDLSHGTFFKLVTDLCSKIDRGEVKIPENLKEAFPSAYAKDLTLGQPPS
jgi:hypothetical protein